MDYQELLNEHIDEDVVVDTDPCFTINVITKTVNSNGIKRELAQYDHNSERITFECDRFIEGHDIMLCNVIRIHYAVATATSAETDSTDEALLATTGTYDVLDVVVSEEDENVVRFTWLVSANVTRRIGVISFTISFECVQEDGTVTYLWSTKPNTELVVIETIRNSETIPEEYVDTFEQWRQQLFGLSDDGVTNIVEASQEQQQAIEDKGAEVLESLPDNYIELSNAVAANTASISGLTERVDSNTIISGASGDAICVYDSADASLKGLTVYGKTTQNGTPTPEAPIELESVGELVTVAVCGKNLFDDVKWFNDNSFILQDDGFWLGNHLNEVCFTNASKKSGSIHISLEARVVTVNTEGGTPLYLMAFYTDGTSEAIITVKSTGNTVLSNTTNAQKTVDYIKWTFGSGGSYCVKNASISFIDSVYEPYKAQSMFVMTSEGLRGVPVTSGGNYTDESGQQWICDEVDFERGVYIKKINNLVLTSNLKISLQSINANGYANFGHTVSERDAGTTPATITRYCNRFAHDRTMIANVTSEGFQLAGGRTLYFRMNSSTVNTVDGFKALLDSWAAEGNPLRVVYELATPIETPLTTEQIEAFKALYSYYPNTTVLNDEGAGLAVKYIADTKNYIDYKISTLLASASQ